MKGVGVTSKSTSSTLIRIGYCLSLTVPLDLTLLGPVIVNILLFHTFLQHAGLQPAALVTALMLFLLWANRSAFAGLIRR
jgi:hypothetical protein